jgi:acetyltransferase-like isoleucine patch superfamily enzyme
MSQNQPRIFNGFVMVPKAFRLFLLHLHLRRHRVVYGKKLRGNGCLITNKGTIELGINVCLNSGLPFRTGLFAYFPSSKIKIGNYCLLNGTEIHSRKEVMIGDNCMFAPGVVILDNDSHNTSVNPNTRRNGEPKESPVAIGNNVWIGMRSIIMKGVKIGDNSVVAACSVVTKDIPSNQLFGGNPAIFLKNLEQ